MNHSPRVVGLASPVVTSVPADGYDELEASATNSMRSSTRRRRGCHDGSDGAATGGWERTLLDLERMQRENKERLQGSVTRAGSSEPATPGDASFSGHDTMRSEERLSASAMRRRRGQPHSSAQEHQQRRFEALVAEYQQKSPTPPAPLVREDAPTLASMISPDDATAISVKPIPRLPLNWNEEAPRQSSAGGSKPLTEPITHLPNRQGQAALTASSSGSAAATVSPSTASMARSASAGGSPNPASPPQPTGLPAAAIPAAATSDKRPYRTTRAASLGSAPSVPQQTESLKRTDISPSPPAQELHTPPAQVITPANRPVSADRTPLSTTGNKSSPSSSPAPQPSLPTAASAKGSSSLGKDNTSTTKGSALPTRPRPKVGSTASDGPAPGAKAKAAPTAQAFSPQPSATNSVRTSKGLPTRPNPSTTSVTTAAAAPRTSAAAQRRASLSGPNPPSPLPARLSTPEQPAVSAAATEQRNAATPVTTERLSTKLEREGSLASSARRSGRVPMTNTLTEIRRLEVLRERKERERKAEEEAALRAGAGRRQSPLASGRVRRTTPTKSGSAPGTEHRRTSTSPAAASKYGTPPATSGPVVRGSNEVSAARPDSPARPKVTSAAPNPQRRAVPSPNTRRTSYSPNRGTQPAAAVASPVAVPASTTTGAATAAVRRTRHADPKTCEVRPSRASGKSTTSTAATKKTTTVPAEPLVKAPARSPVAQDLEAQRTTAGGEEAQPPTAAPVPFCIECGRRHIDENAKFCAFCGHKREIV